MWPYAPSLRTAESFDLYGIGVFLPEPALRWLPEPEDVAPEGTSPVALKQASACGRRLRRCSYAVRWSGAPALDTERLARQHWEATSGAVKLPKPAGLRGLLTITMVM